MPVVSLPPAPIEVLAFEPQHYVMSRWHNITMIYWMNQATGPAVRLLSDLTRRVASECPQGFSNIHIVKEGAPLPDADARAGFAAMMEDHAKSMACVAIVLMGGGFWASALQGIGTSLRMITPRTYMMRFARSPDELRVWLPHEHSRRTRHLVDGTSLSNAIDHVFRASHEPALQRQAIG